MQNADLAFNTLQMSLNLLKRRSVCLFDEADAKMERLAFEFMARIRNIWTSSYGLTNDYSSSRRSSATYCSAQL